MECGADGIIAPGTRPDRVNVLRRIVCNRKILSPGIGAQGGEAEAVARIVDGIIVGRAIYEADNPGNAAMGFARVVRRKNI
jgi:orotidine-5'-phosphate decarboxylase